MLFWGARFWVAKRGGDICKKGCASDQTIHGDSVKQRPNKGKDVVISEWIAASVAVHDIEEAMAPMRIITRTQMMQHEFNKQPALEEEPQQWLQQKLCMRRGQILLRDPRVWHGGTRNFSEQDRFLPGLVWRMDYHEV